jgi:ribosomal protein S18 acetylase RimI-like enzyme
MTANIRQAHADDHAVVVGVVDEWWGGRRMAALLPSLFFEHFSSTSLIAEDEDGMLAGFLVGFDSADHPGQAYVHFIGVRPDHRGRGLGRELHGHFAREAAGRGITSITCVTSTANEVSIAFHTSIGFVVAGIDEPVIVDGIDDVVGHVRLVRDIRGMGSPSV